MHEGLMAMTIALVSVVGSFLVLLAIVITAIRARNRRNEMLHQERMLAIEKGLPLPPDYLERMPRRRPYWRGLVFSGVGVGLMIFGLINAQEDGDWDLFGIGVVFLAVGVAMIIADRITTKQSNGWNASSLPYSAPEMPRPVEGNRS